MRLVRLLPFLLAVACTEHRAAPPPAPSAPSAPAGLALPERLSGFETGASDAGPTFVRRTYQRGPAQFTVTLARFAMTQEQYDQWVRTSTASYPQAALELPAGAGNGFYECAPEDPQRCDLLIQLRSGAHLELRGNRQATRADVDALARALPLRALAE